MGSNKEANCFTALFHKGYLMQNQSYISEDCTERVHHTNEKINYEVL